MSFPTRILLIKTSSLGDVLHNLPVVTDIHRHFPAATIDWVVEESFAALPLLHPQVNSVIAVAMRRWRKSWWAARSEIQTVCQHLRSRHYDYVVDTQGLLKSALISRCSKAPKFGYAWGSAREPLASWFYDHTYHVPKQLHAVTRNRQLAATALGYQVTGVLDYGIHAPATPLTWLPNSPYVVLLHATSRDDKLWQESNWIALAVQLAAQGYYAVLPWGNEVERVRSERLCEQMPKAICAPRLNLNEAACLLGNADAAIGVDTGLNHLAAALGVPTVGIYTATDPGLTGLYAGTNALNLGGTSTPPSVTAVIAALDKLLKNKSNN